MRVNTASNLDMSRRMIQEAERIFAFMGGLVDENDDLVSQELADMFYEMIDNIIEFRCALESATYEGLDHFDQEA